MLFVDNDPRAAINLKWVLTYFELVSGMSINYHKSELVPINLEETEIHTFLDIFQCVKGDFPIKYFGIPLHFDKLRREDLQPMIDALLARMAGWRGKLLSLLGRVTLVKTCLASIPIYMLSFFKFPKWAISLINSQLTNCLWSDNEGGQKIHLANWQSVCTKKEYCGMGIPNL